jgi:sphingosine kinase
MISDIDIESEIIRFMGILRNDIWAVWRVINLRTYRGKFSFLRIDQMKPGDKVKNNFPAFNEEVPSNWLTIEENFILFWASQVSHASITTFQSPDSDLNDGIFNILVIRKPCSRLEIVKILLGLEHGSHVKNAKAEIFPCVAFRMDPISRGSQNDLDGEVVEQGRIQGRITSFGIKIFA